MAEPIIWGDDWGGPMKLRASSQIRLSDFARRLYEWACMPAGVMMATRPVSQLLWGQYFKYFKGLCGVLCQSSGRAWSTSTATSLRCWLASGRSVTSWLASRCEPSSSCRYTATAALCSRCAHTYNTLDNFHYDIVLPYLDLIGAFISIISSHLSWSHFVRERIALWLIAAAANWVALQRTTTQLAVTTTNYSALGSDETRSNEMGWMIWTLVETRSSVWFGARDQTFSKIRF